MECHKIIYELRKKRGLEQTAVAKDLGISREILNHWESGTRQIKAEHIAKLAEYYNVTADYLLGLDPNETASADLKAVCNYTGLSVAAIEKIKSRADLYDLSAMLESDSFLDIVSQLDYLRGAYNKTVDSMEVLDHYYETTGLDLDEDECSFAVETFCEWFPSLRMQIFELSEMWSDLLESFFPSRELITDGKELYNNVIEYY